MTETHYKFTGCLLAVLLHLSSYLERAVQSLGLQVPDVNTMIQASTDQKLRRGTQTHTGLFFLNRELQKYVTNDRNTKYCSTDVFLFSDDSCINMLFYGSLILFLSYSGSRLKFCSVKVFSLHYGKHFCKSSQTKHNMQPYMLITGANNQRSQTCSSGWKKQFTMFVQLRDSG